MRSAILIQARSGSTRLPNKCFLEFPAVVKTADASTVENTATTITERVYHQCIQAGVPVYFLLPDGDTKLQSFLKEKQIEFMTGPEDDVRQRYRKAAAELKLDVVVRVTADNPFTDPLHLKLSLQEMQLQQCDLFSFDNLPLGVAAELFTADALFDDGDAGLEALPMYKEHVSLHIKHSNKFRVIHKSSPLIDDWRRLHNYEGSLPRLTIDEPADYTTLHQVAKKQSSDSLTELLDMFLNNDQLFAGNQKVEQRRFYKITRNDENESKS